MPGSGRQPINAPAGARDASGVPWIGLGILLVLILILAAFVAYFFFDVGADSGDGPITQLGSSQPAPDGSVGGELGGASVSSLGFPVVATRNTSRLVGMVSPSPRRDGSQRVCGDRFRSDTGMRSSHDRSRRRWASASS